jgi:N-glycosidase YbiA
LVRRVMVAIERFSGPYRFLSNFYPCGVEYKNSSYRSVEHAYQAAKAVNESDRAWVASMPTAAEAKKAGRVVQCRDDWNSVKVGIMEECLRSKFSSPYLRHLLVSTTPQELVEGNWWGDTFWGVCKGVGENRLGKLLMKIRDEVMEVDHGN